MARSRSSSRHKNYPHRGTKAGDGLIGTCDGRDCGVELRRGDPFVTTVSGHLVCRPCWEKPDWHGLIEEPITREEAKAFAEACATLPDEEELDIFEKPKVVDEDYGPDNPFF